MKKLTREQFLKVCDDVMKFVNKITDNDPDKMNAVFNECSAQMENMRRFNDFLDDE